MRKIKMLQDERTVIGPLQNGQTLSVEDSLAKDLVGLGVAEYADAPAETETIVDATAGAYAFDDLAPDYSAFTVEELKMLLRGRDLPVSGNKAELIARMEKWRADEY